MDIWKIHSVCSLLLRLYLLLYRSSISFLAISHSRYAEADDKQATIICYLLWHTSLCNSEPVATFSPHFKVHYGCWELRITLEEPIISVYTYLAVAHNLKLLNAFPMTTYCDWNVHRLYSQHERKDSMKNFFRSFISSDRENNVNMQDQPESIELNEQELADATGGCGDDCHHHHHHHHHYCHRHHCYDDCYDDYCY